MNKILAIFQITLIMASLIVVGMLARLIEDERQNIENAYIYHLRNSTSETIYIDIEHDGEWQTIPLTPNREVSIIGG